MLCVNLELIGKFFEELWGFENRFGGELHEIGGIYLKMFLMGSKFVSAALARLTHVPRSTQH